MGGAPVGCGGGAGGDGRASEQNFARGLWIEVARGDPPQAFPKLPESPYAFLYDGNG